MATNAKEAIEREPKKYIGSFCYWLGQFHLNPPLTSTFLAFFNHHGKLVFNMQAGDRKKVRMDKG
jgi:hypothetical protein